MVKKLLKKIRGSEFNRNFLTLLSGSILTQLIPIVASVFLTRLYTPEDFGVLAIFNSLIIILTSIANLRYEFAIMLPKENEDAIAISFFAAIISFFFSILLLIVFVFFKDPILHFIGGEKLGDWLYLVPLTVFLNGIYNVLKNFTLRFKMYKTIANSSVIRSGSSALIQIEYGLLGMNKVGLILGVILSILFGNFRMAKLFYSHRELFKNVNYALIKTNAIRYKNFPLISVWGILLTNASTSINNFFISRFFGLNQLGFYSYSYRYLNIPLALVGTSLGQIFFQVCAEKNKLNQDARDVFISTLKKLIIIMFPLLLVTFFVIEDLFALVFGEEWRIAGYYSKILIPVFLFRSIFGPLTSVTQAFEKQFIMLFIQALIFFVNIALFWFVYLYKISLVEFLFYYSSVLSVMYIISIYIMYLVAAKKI
jgi:O-antigen/teichoic acid export membrane protein